MSALAESFQAPSRLGRKRPDPAKLQAAFKACKSLAPSGAAGAGAGFGGFRQSPAFKKYAACLKKHGVTFPKRPAGSRPPAGSAPPSGTRPNFTASPKFKAAAKACASLRPKRPGNA